MAKCSICGAEYNYCPNCAKTHAWRFYADTPECYQIFLILKEYGAYHDKDVARNAFKNIGITSSSDLIGFKPKIAERISAIIKEEPKEQTVIKKPKKSKLYKED